jgi:hypothetical protein
VDLIVLVVPLKRLGFAVDEQSAFADDEEMVGGDDISPIWWLDTRTVRPSVAICPRRTRKQMMPSGSSPFGGSSRTRTGGSPSSAPASPRRWAG